MRLLVMITQGKEMEFEFKNHGRLNLEHANE